MLLALTQHGDQTAERFAAFARAHGAPCLLVDEHSESVLSVRATRDRRVTSTWCVAGERVTPRGILNRMAPLRWDTAPEAQFRAAERYAAWWCAVAAFEGPVINRPTRGGYLPNLDLLPLAREVSPLRPTPGAIACGAPERMPAGVVNVHRQADGQYLGRLADLPAPDADEVRRYTPLDPARTVHLLVAGQRLFDLSHASGRVTPVLAARLEPLAAALRRREATFCSVVIEPDGDAPRLLHASALPQVEQYAHVEDAVHGALLEYLL